jgi:AraC-like DNA-binding protein
MNILFHKTMHTSLGNVELMTANHSKHYFPRHFHETFPFGVVIKGALGFHYRGEKVTAWRGTINLANPGEIHDGFPASDNGWQYRMFYIDRQVVNQLLNQNQNPDTFPWFRTGVINDQALAAKTAWLHYWMEQNVLTELETESQFAMLLDELISRHALQHSSLPSIYPDKQTFTPVFEHLRENTSQTWSLKEMASACGFSVGYFIRAFKKISGLTPHQYQLVCRIERARSQILTGKSLILAANENGFVDQSHFHKTFKRFYGYTPAALQIS